MYNIKITYITGDSFGSCETEDLVGCSWNNLDLAKKALKDIREHHKFFSGYSYERKSRDEIKDKSWFAREKDSYMAEYTLKLQDDSGEFQTISAFWMGYFESLIEAEIIEDDPDMKFTIIKY